MSKLQVPQDAAGARLDAWLAQTVPGHSRGRWQALIKGGHVTLDGEVRKPGHLLRGGEDLRYEIPDAEPIELEPEDIALDVLFEDAAMIAINKPPGLVVHPAPGHATGTLVQALLHHCGDLTGVGGELRPGIVHRLDKDTSGVIVAAKTQDAMTSLTHQFKQREVKKKYLALVKGVPRPASGTIETQIGRSQSHRKKMSTSPRAGRDSVSHFEVIEAFGDAALVAVRIETGRTHQIRVHMAHIGHPVLGDPLYGGRKHNIQPAPTRQMLHAETLELAHPLTGSPLVLTTPPPEDFQALLDILRLPK